MLQMGSRSLQESICNQEYCSDVEEDLLECFDEALVFETRLVKYIVGYI